jgi:hypothetical protein
MVYLVPPHFGCGEFHVNHGTHCLKHEPPPLLLPPCCHYLSSMRCPTFSPWTISMSHVLYNLATLVQPCQKTTSQQIVGDQCPKQVQKSKERKSVNSLHNQNGEKKEDHGSITRGKEGEGRGGAVPCLLTITYMCEFKAP